MPEQIVRAHGNNPERRRCSEPRIPAAMVGDLQDVYGRGRILKRNLQISGQQDCSGTVSNEQDHRVIVLGGLARLPASWRVEDLDRSNDIACSNPPDGDALLRQQIQKFLVAGSGRVPAQPDFPNPEIAHNVQQPIHVIVMGVGQNHRVQPADSSGKQVGTNHIFTNRETGFISQIQKTAGCDASEIGRAHV